MVDAREDNHARRFLFLCHENMMNQAVRLLARDLVRRQTNGSAARFPLPDARGRNRRGESRREIGIKSGCDGRRRRRNRWFVGCSWNFNLQQPSCSLHQLEIFAHDFPSSTDWELADKQFGAKSLMRMCIMAPFQHPYQKSFGTEATTGMFKASATYAGVRKDASRYSAMKADDRPMTEERMKPIIVKSSGL